jgi:hypothetical protein
LLRSFHLDSPDKSFHPVSLRVQGSQFLVEFVSDVGETSVSRYFLYDSLTGEKRADFQLEEGTGGMLACFDFNTRQFSFLGTNQNGQRTFRTALAR